MTKKKHTTETEVVCAFPGCGQKVLIINYSAHVLSKHQAQAGVSVALRPGPAPAAAAPVTETAPAMPSPAVIPGQTTLPGTAVGAQAQVTAPPALVRNPRINAQLLYQNGGRLEGAIVGVRPGRGTQQYGAFAGGWFIDVDVPGKGTYTGLVVVGDKRHQTLWARFGANWLGQKIVIRLPQASDNTRAQWVIE